MSSIKDPSGNIHPGNATSKWKVHHVSVSMHFILEEEDSHGHLGLWKVHVFSIRPKVSFAPPYLKQQLPPGDIERQHRDDASNCGGGKVIPCGQTAPACWQQSTVGVIGVVLLGIRYTDLKVFKE